MSKSQILMSRSVKEQILADPAASYWLKAAIKDLAQRDPVDSLHDALTLVKVCEERLEFLR